MPQRSMGFYEKYVKRVLDVICSLAALTVFCWLYAAVAIAVRVKLGSPVIFRQPRPGRIDPKTGKERIFYLYKFRSMTDERDENGELLPDEARLTRFGKMLRATSLDELPEAINILKGEMSVIGPRPLLVSYLPLYTPHQARRHEVRPGITGLAQVHGRNAITWEEKFEWDVKYVDNISFKCDLKILLETVGAVIRHEGINGKNSVTMEKFTGSKTGSDGE